MSSRNFDKDLFNQHINKASGNSDEHWYWTGPSTEDGVGYFKYGAKTFRSYVLAWNEINSEPEKGFTLRRTCNQPTCISPFHRELIEASRQTVGVRHGKAKITDADVIDIRDQYDKGVTQKTLSTRYQVSQPQISMIVRGKAWSHVG